MSLFAAGITLTADGTGALVVFEKIPRQTGRMRDAVYDGLREKEPIWECAFRLVGAEQLSGTLPSMASEVRNRVHAEPMRDDSDLRLEIGSLGRQVLPLFRERDVSVWPVLVGGEREGTDAQGTMTLPVSTLQATSTLMFETGRVEITEGLVEGPSIMHALEKIAALPSRGPARDLGVAAAIALHTSAVTSGGKWPSRKPKPPAMLEEEERTRWAREVRRRAFDEAKRRHTRPW